MCVQAKHVRKEAITHAQSDNVSFLTVEIFDPIAGVVAHSGLFSLTDIQGLRDNFDGSGISRSGQVVRKKASGGIV